jgi:DNA-binding winged helix-turn-helix (wHTH) protein/tetratricopeptide (TPR) repeat protein
MMGRMLKPSEATVRFRFGPYEVDLRSAELRKNGIKLKMQELPFNLLVALLERPGEIVSREQLQAKLWPEGTFVDVEGGLGTALNKLRGTLCDSAADPRFIETVPRRGYRFIAEVQKEVQTPEAEVAEPVRPEAVAPQVGPVWNNSAAVFIVGVVIVLLAFGVAYPRFRRGPKPLTDQDVLVLADFTNTTGDAAFDGSLRQALAFELEQSPFLKIMDDEEVNQTLQLMGRPAGQRIANETAYEVCVREAQKATIGGSIAGFGRNYQIALQAVNCQTGATLAREQAVAEDKEHVLKAVAKAATGMRAKLGESLGSIQTPGRHSAFEVTTNSLEALKAYQLGWNLLAQNSAREAIPQFQLAIQMDPTFAHAYDMLGIAYRNSSQPTLANQALSKAFALVDRVSERERLYISGHYYYWVKRDMDKALDAYQVAVRTYPRFAPPYNGLFSVHASRGEYQKALEAEQEALRLEPRNLVFISNLMGTYLALDRLDDAKAVAGKTLAQKPDQPMIHNQLLYIADIQDDRAAQEKEIQWFSGKREEYLRPTVQALDAVVHGQRREAKQLYQRAAELARLQGLTDFRPGPSYAVIDALMGDCERARKEKSNPALVLCGDATALRLAEEHAAKGPPSNPDAANLLYQRGLAWLRARKATEAAAEFQKILNNRGNNWGPFYSVSYLGLARASALAGDTAKAKRAYQDFLGLWKDADRDLPFLSQANKELEALR